MACFKINLSFNIISPGVNPTKNFHFSSTQKNNSKNRKMGERKVKNFNFCLIVLLTNGG